MHSNERNNIQEKSHIMIDIGVRHEIGDTMFKEKHIKRTCHSVHSIGIITHKVLKICL